MQQNTGNEDFMSPDVSPGDASGRSGVRRATHLPLYIVGGATLLFLVIMVMVAADRAAKQSRMVDDTDKEKVTNASLAANEITGKYTSGIVPTESKPLDIPLQAMIPEEPPTVVRPTNRTNRCRRKRNWPIGYGKSKRNSLKRRLNRKRRSTSLRRAVQDRHPCRQAAYLSIKRSWRNR